MELRITQSYTATAPYAFVGDRDREISHDESDQRWFEARARRARTPASTYPAKPHGRPARHGLSPEHYGY